MRPASLALSVALALSAVACAYTSAEDGPNPDDMPTSDDAAPTTKATKSTKPGTAFETDGGTTGEASTTTTMPPLADACVLDTRTVYIAVDGRTIESITANQRYYSRVLTEDGSAVEGAGFPEAVSAEPKFETLCAGHDVCRLDSRAVYYDQGQKIETFTGYGMYYVYNHSTGSPVLVDGFPQVLTETPAFAAGPCEGHTTDCKFDTRALYSEGGTKVETITAYGRMWTFRILSDGTRIPSVNGVNLTEVARFKTVCGNETSKCKFDTRTVYVGNDALRVEEITAHGRLWAFTLDANDHIVETRAAGTPLTSIPRFQGPCAH